MLRNQKPTKKEIIEYYANQLHTIDESCRFFGVSKSKFYRCLKEYNIIRTKEDKAKVYSRAQNSEELKNRIKDIKTRKYGDTKFVRFISDNSFMIKDKEYTVKWLIEEYCHKNTRLVDICNILDISPTVFYQICQHYNIYKTNQQRYENIQHTITEKYGVISTLQLESIKLKSKQTLLSKYNVDNVMKNNDIKEKIKRTNIKKYGYEYATQSNIIKEKVKKTCLDRYGSEYHSQRNIEHFDVWNNQTLMINYLSSLKTKPTISELAQYFNCDGSSICDKIHNFKLDEMVAFRPARSQYEDEIIQWLHSIDITNIQINNRVILEGKEIDIYLPDHNLGIEFNGNYWHSDIYCDDHSGRSIYHQEKSLYAESKNIFLFHIFEYEWVNPVIKENILNRLKTLLQKNSIRIPARKCQITELSKAQKKDFLDKNHIQGNDHSTKQYGLIYDGELVSCMTFVHPKNNKYTWELSRFCNKCNYIVQGGASKLFKYFTDILNNGDTVSSYNDITKTKGDLYKILGFECVSINSPNYVWINFTTGDIRTRYQEQAGGEVERMHKQGYHRICDCGTKTWVYTKTN